MSVAAAAPRAGGARMIGSQKGADPVRADGWKGVALSIILHAALFVAGSWLWVKPITYGVAAGESAIEVELVAAPAAVPPAVDPAPAIPEPFSEPEPESDTVRPPDPPPTTEALSEKIPDPAPIPDPPGPVRPIVQASGPVGDGSSPVPGKDAITQRSSAGAQTAARPNYLRNPAPRYPETSRKNGEEGLVLLRVEVGPSGRPTSVELDAGSGFERLDRAAIDAVKRWIFEPARLGPLPVASTVKVPIRFRLSDRS